MTLCFFIKMEIKLKLLHGEIMNIKITEKKGFEEFKKIYEERKKNINFRVGNGFDVHKFKKGKKLKLLGS